MYALWSRQMLVRRGQSNRHLSTRAQPEHRRPLLAYQRQLTLPPLPTHEITRLSTPVPVCHRLVFHSQLFVSYKTNSSLLLFLFSIGFRQCVVTMKSQCERRQQRRCDLGEYCRPIPFALDARWLSYVCQTNESKCIALRRFETERALVQQIDFLTSCRLLFAPYERVHHRRVVLRRIDCCRSTLTHAKQTCTMTVRLWWSQTMYLSSCTRHSLSRVVQSVCWGCTAARDVGR
mmetsp:Transcript_19834/g.34033  ORF Transcript_19834/g.34033 Transcript_19834/m.34033 type:complete len:233 (-) Transcript_19834:860-1558(-)